MKAFIFCALMATAMAADPMMLADVFDFSSQVYADAIVGGGPSNSADYMCDPRHLNTTQVTFNNALGISPTLTYLMPTIFTWLLMLFFRVPRMDILKFAMPVKLSTPKWELPMLIVPTLCYLTSLLGPSGNLSNSFGYSSMWSQLDFICNAGFHIGIQSFQDLMLVYGTDAGKACYGAFLTNVNSDPVNRCSYVATYMVCIQEAYVAHATNRPNGWWICERARVGYNYACTGLRCECPYHLNLKCFSDNF